MFGRKFTISLVAASMIAAPVTRASAGNDAAALLGGAILGGIIVNEVNKNKQRKQAAARSAAARQAQRQRNREVQTALNYFGYNAGVVDGVIGRRSRAAISRFQKDMGFAADGHLEPHERDFLIGSYQRAIAVANQPPYNRILASRGPRGLLRAFRDEQLGVATATPQPPAARAALPAFDLAADADARKPSRLCDEIGVITAANGGPTAAGRVVDGTLALNEQFCMARSDAMAETARMETALKDLTPGQIAQQCRSLAQAMAPILADLGQQRPSRIIADTSALLRDSGKPMEQLTAAGQVCLGVGYRMDDAQLALAAAVLLTGGGRLGYGELVSHHLREGLGVDTPQPELAGDWMRLALNALRNGGTPAPGQSADRLAVLSEASTAVAQVGGGAAAALPAFPVPNAGD